MDHKTQKKPDVPPRPLLRLVPASPEESVKEGQATRPKSQFAEQLSKLADQVDRDMEWWLKF